MNQDALWNVKAAFNTIMMAHPLCECPSEEEEEAAQDAWCCENCLCMEGLTELNKLFPELEKSGNATESQRVT